eukprot:UN25213
MQIIVDNASEKYNVSYSVGFMHTDLDGPYSIVGGIQDHATGQKIVHDDLIPVGSVTKNTWAVATMRLVEKGIIDLDEKIVDTVDPWLSKHYGLTLQRHFLITLG